MLCHRQAIPTLSHSVSRNPTRSTYLWFHVDPPYSMTHHCISSSLILFHLALHVCHHGREWWRVTINGHRWALMGAPKLAYGCMIFTFLSRNSLQTRQTYRATDIAEMMFDSIYNLHGLPEQIISDRDSLFTSKFWRRLHWLLNTKLQMSSAFHPQTDGATKRANHTITQMIRQCVRSDQKDWVIVRATLPLTLLVSRIRRRGYLVCSRHH